ncbi:ferritin-like domain-containing protein [Sphingomonas glacialis]|uniref:Ferritin-like domain-containing protein n=1 Tax=Sphingomonas glacialis TaxID=658225 RepID=A0A502FZ05_9SPHN|nr:ferritin-like domain-containing protein [Sphingomonas glacialis]TPG54734.1 ferritin-like domain-containing protein [Sphingomonas glacialis]
MTDQTILTQVLEAGERRRHERRQFMRTAATASIAVGGLSLLAACNDDTTSAPTPTPTPTPTTSASQQTDLDVLNFALNLEYLEAQFYVNAVYGQGLPAAALTGTGTQGAVTGGRQVTFTDPVVAQYAREIAADESAHVNFLRSALGSAAVAQPAINIDGGANGAFTLAARAAGIATNASGAIDNVAGTFDPYANDINFLLGAFIFEDVGVSAYKGAAPLITNKTYLEAAAGILAAEAYHAGLVRTVLYAKGLATPSIVTAAGKISDARDSLDGASDDDQGIAGPDASQSNIVPTDANGIAYSRTTGQVLNIVYLSKSALVGGGFFPNGINGNIRTSAAN